METRHALVVDDEVDERRYLASILEEGAEEMSLMKVPAGRENLQRGLLELLHSLSLSYHEVARSLSPPQSEHGEEGEAAQVHGEEDHESVEGNHESGGQEEPAHGEETNPAPAGGQSH